MTRLSSDHINLINQRLPKLEEHYQSITGKSVLEIAHFASGTDFLPLEQRSKLTVASIPISCGDGIIGDFSETVALVLKEFAGVNTFVTECTDVAGFNEALVKKADMVFMADDKVCLCLNLRTGAHSDNGFATGRGFAALLYLSAHENITEEVLVLGAGKVGAGAYHFLQAKHVPVRWYDLKESSPHGLDAQLLAGDWKKREWNYIIDATTSPSFIGADQIKAGGIISAPGIPFGVSNAAYKKAGLVIRDELETGIMSMFCEASKHA
ncbi:MAG: 3-methylornithyl-N6-L-lysine dehydrogenase PylD [Coriobacteriia bacterium]|nr:3-methylornithyl-N6-L-lysine dehydrogenase PylD [Coriobacteriia bacterium]MCL2750652.1 3-methylornithyl-N6-L-lysine dehydrogenase PylD [Coriobacteriia bacterium]